MRDGLSALKLVVVKSTRPSTTHFSFSDTDTVLEGGVMAGIRKIPMLFIAAIILIILAVIGMGAVAFSHQYTESEMKRALDAPR